MARNTENRQGPAQFQWRRGMLPGVDKVGEAADGAALRYFSGIQENNGQPLKGGEGEPVRRPMGRSQEKGVE